MEILFEILVCPNSSVPSRLKKRQGVWRPREEVTTEQVARSLKSAYTGGIAVVSADYLARYSLCVHLSFGRQKKKKKKVLIPSHTQYGASDAKPGETEEGQQLKQ